METTQCPQCNNGATLGSESIESSHRTGAGPIAYVRCPNGHRFLTYLTQWTTQYA